MAWHHTARAFFHLSPSIKLPTPAITDLYGIEEIDQFTCLLRFVDSRITSIVRAATIKVLKEKPFAPYKDTEVPPSPGLLWPQHLPKIPRNSRVNSAYMTRRAVEVPS